MNNHLSADQFTQCVLAQPTAAERQHLAQCPECSAALQRLDKTLSLFRGVIRERIDERIALHAQGATAFAIRPARTAIPKWRWALLAAAAVVLAMLPFVNRENKPQEVSRQQPAETNPEAIMRRVNLHLSRTVPAPMQPLLLAIPDDEPKIKSGGVQ